MNTTNALATRQTSGLLPDAETWGTMIQMAEALFRSGLLPSSIKSPQAAVAVIQKGTELGIPPMAALTSIVVIQGKPTANAELMLALIYRDHGDNAIVFTHSDNTQCEVAYKRRGWAKAQTYTFTMADAKQASLLSNQTWQKYPAAMLRARCVSAVARMAFPDSIGGMHTPEEIGANVDVVDGEVVVIDQNASPHRQHIQRVEAMTGATGYWPQGEMAEMYANQDEARLEDAPVRGIVDVLTDEMDSDDPHVMTVFDMLADLTDRRDLNDVRAYIDDHGLRGNNSVMDAYSAAYERLTRKKAPRSTNAANDAQPSLIEA